MYVYVCMCARMYAECKSVSVCARACLTGVRRWKELCIVLILLSLLLCYIKTTVTLYIGLEP